MQNLRTNRRDWLRSVGLGGAAAIAVSAGIAVPTAVGQTAGNRKRSIRLAHLTDAHIEPELGADVGVAACLQHAQSRADKPEMILYGGDCVFDSMASDRAHTQLQWDLWKKTFKDNCSLPVEACIGNHDVFGWNQKKSGATAGDPGYGKAMAMEMLGLAKAYRSFDKSGWHFVLLDGIFPDDAHFYKGRLDEDQFAWLSDDLAKTPVTTPVLVMSHIPIFSVTPMADPKAQVDEKVTVSASMMHGDFPRIRTLFKQHPNVKLCLSGHTHLIDRVEYTGVTYICDGAVSGDWWKGNHLGECDNGYGLLDLYDDGSFDHQYQTYGWKARTAG